MIRNCLASVLSRGAAGGGDFARLRVFAAWSSLRWREVAGDGRMDARKGITRTEEKWNR